MKEIVYKQIDYLDAYNNLKHDERELNIFLRILGPNRSISEIDKESAKQILNQTINSIEHYKKVIPKGKQEDSLLKKLRHESNKLARLLYVNTKK